MWFKLGLTWVVRLNKYLLPLQVLLVHFEALKMVSWEITLTFNVTLHCYLDHIMALVACVAALYIIFKLHVKECCLYIKQ